MSEHTFPSMTPVDALVSDDNLQAIKACIPFFDLNEQPALLAFAKFTEFRKALQLAREQKDELASLQHRTVHAHTCPYAECHQGILYQGAAPFH